MFIAPTPISSPRTATPAFLDIAGLLSPAAWLGLPASLRRRFAVGHGPLRFHGTMDLHRSRAGAVFAVLARCLGAPLPLRHETGAAVTVSVCADGDGIAWERRLGHQVVRSVKSAGPGGTVLERTRGGLGMVLDVTAEDGALVFTSRSFFLSVGRWRLPVPAALTPGRCRVAHRAIDDTRFRFTLTMTHPFWGTTFRQDGVFTDGGDDAADMPESQP